MIIIMNAWVSLQVVFGFSRVRIIGVRSRECLLYLVSDHYDVVSTFSSCYIHLINVHMFCTYMHGTCGHSCIQPAAVCGQIKLMIPHMCTDTCTCTWYTCMYSMCCLLRGIVLVPVRSCQTTCTCRKQLGYSCFLCCRVALQLVLYVLRYACVAVCMHLYFIELITAWRILWNADCVLQTHTGSKSVYVVLLYLLGFVQDRVTEALQMAGLVSTCNKTHGLIYCTQVHYLTWQWHRI